MRAAGKIYPKIRPKEEPVKPLRSGKREPYNRRKQLFPRRRFVMRMQEPVFEALEKLSGETGKSISRIIHELLREKFSIRERPGWREHERRRIQKNVNT